MPIEIEVTSGGGVPPGVYPARYERAERHDEGEFGAATKLIFEITGGDHAGETTSRFCSLKLSPKSNLFKFVVSLSGREPQPGEKIALDSFAGVCGSVVVEELPSGSTRVSAFIRAA